MILGCVFVGSLLGRTQVQQQAVTVSSERGAPGRGSWLGAIQQDTSGALWGDPALWWWTRVQAAAPDPDGS